VTGGKRSPRAITLTRPVPLVVRPPVTGRRGTRSRRPAQRRTRQSLVTGLPLDLKFRTKGQLAAGICAEAYADGVTFDIICGIRSTVPARCALSYSAQVAVQSALLSGQLVELVKERL
jgi:hypothetical protein